MGSLVRAAGLRGLVPLVDGLGGDGAALLARFRVPPEALDSDDAVVAATTAGRLLETAAAELDCPDLGLRLAEQQDTSVLGPLAVAIENSTTMGDALDCASRFLFVQSPTLSVALGSDPERRPGVLGLYYRSAERGRPAPQAIDLGLGLFHRIISLLHGTGYGLRSAHLPHSPLAPVARYTGFFGTDVRFDRADAVLRVPAGLVDAPVRGGDGVLRTLAVEYLESHFGAPGRTLTARVHAALARSLGTSPPRIGPVARLFRMHPRTLQRHLAAEGTTFEAVLDDVRREATHRLLTRTDLPLSQIAGMVGFTEQSALTRAARRWFGEAPSRVRRAGRGAPSTATVTVAETGGVGRVSTNPALPSPSSRA